MPFRYRSALYQVGALALAVGVSGLPWNHSLNGPTFVDVGFALVGLLALLVNCFTDDWKEAGARDAMRAHLKKLHQRLDQSTRT